MTTDVASIAHKSMVMLHRAPEPEVLKPLLDRAALTPESRERVMGHALGLLADLRAAQGKGWVNQFLQEYQLNSSEGIALLSLAEAFLRVPDPETADLLIADKLGDADWRAHTGKSNSTLVNSATWGLVLGRVLVGEGEQQSALRRLISRAGEPFVRQAVGAAMRMMGEIFVMGRTIEEAMKRMRRPEHKGFTASFDMLGEEDGPDAGRCRTLFPAPIPMRSMPGREATRRADGHSISVKLSALHPRYEVPQWDRCVPRASTAECSRCWRHRRKLGRRIALTVDAEESERLSEMRASTSSAQSPALPSAQGLGWASAWRCRPMASAPGQWSAWANALGEKTGRLMNAAGWSRSAYWDSEKIKRTQDRGTGGLSAVHPQVAGDLRCLLSGGLREGYADGEEYPPGLCQPQWLR